MSGTGWAILAGIATLSAGLAARLIWLLLADPMRLMAFAW